MTTQDAGTWVTYGLVALGVLVAALVWVIYRKGRPFMAGDVFRESRWSRGNHLFPTQVAVTPTSVVQHTPRWIGKEEESIHIAHVASVKINTHLVFSEVIVETSGGSGPIVCRGHWKSDALRIKALIERYQTEQFRPSRG
jgi:hypothetical protein